jgi:signal transduction histidine kinase
MKNFKKIKPVILSIIFLIALLIFLILFFNKENIDKDKSISIDTSLYQYQQTIDLINFVKDAAVLIKNNEKNAFSQFKNHDSKWLKDDRYIMVYDMNGNCILTPGYKTLEKKSIKDLLNINGNMIFDLYKQAVSNSEIPYGWVHYFGYHTNYIFPERESFFLIKVKGSSGKKYIVCSKVYDIKIEKVFIKNYVDSVAELIKQNGGGIFNELNNGTTGINTSVFSLFVIDIHGHFIVNPYFKRIKNGNFPRDYYQSALKITDYTGMHPIEKLIKVLKKKSETWIGYMTSKPNQSTQNKILIYARKIKIKDNYYIVGSGMFANIPIWMNN